MKAPTYKLGRWAQEVFDRATHPMDVVHCELLVHEMLVEGHYGEAFGFADVIIEDLGAQAHTVGIDWDTCRLLLERRRYFEGVRDVLRSITYPHDREFVRSIPKKSRLRPVSSPTEIRRLARAAAK